jgi:hypothetical protein
MLHGWNVHRLLYLAPLFGLLGKKARVHSHNVPQYARLGRYPIHYQYP